MADAKLRGLDLLSAGPSAPEPRGRRVPVARGGRRRERRRAGAPGAGDPGGAISQACRVEEDMRLRNDGCVYIYIYPNRETDRPLADRARLNPGLFETSTSAPSQVHLPVHSGRITGWVGKEELRE